MPLDKQKFEFQEINVYSNFGRKDIVFEEYSYKDPQHYYSILISRTGYVRMQVDRRVTEVPTTVHKAIADHFDLDLKF